MFPKINIMDDSLNNDDPSSGFSVDHNRYANDKEYRSQVDARIQAQINSIYGDESIDKALKRAENIPNGIGSVVKEFRNILHFAGIATKENANPSDALKAGRNMFDNLNKSDILQDPDDDVKDNNTGLNSDPYSHREMDYGGDTGGGISTSNHDQTYAVYDTIGSHGSGLNIG